MATQFKTPGVYVKEIPSLPASVAAVPTAVPAFVGYTKLHLTNVPGCGIDSNPCSAATKIYSMAEYESLFGGPYTNLDMAIATGIITENAMTFNLWHSLKFYFQNGGGPCYIISVGDYEDDFDAATLALAIPVLSLEDEPTIIVVPEATMITDNLSVDPFADYYDLYDQFRSHCGTMRDRFLIEDVKTDDSGTDLVEESMITRRDADVAYPSYGAAYFPYLNTLLKYDESCVKIVGNPSGGGAPTLNGLTLSTALETSTNLPYLLPVLSTAKAGMAALTITLPPSPAIAGIYCRTDRERGVWKAPANVSLSGVASPTVKISDQDQEGMNVDQDAGKSVNAIRFFTGRGNLVWGARTLAGNDNEWKYVPVRRLFLMMEESIQNAMEAVVFEPNDANTWNRVKGTIENFLNSLWKQGALAGIKPEDAYYVKVGLGSTMTEIDLLEGLLIVDVAVAAVRPAEFIIIRFSHKLQTS